MSIYDLIPDPAVIDLEPSSEVERPFRYLSLLHESIKCDRITLFTCGGAREKLEPSVSTIEKPPFAIFLSDWKTLNLKKESEPFQVNYEDSSYNGVLCPYEIPEGNLPSCLYFEFGDLTEARSKLEICKLGAHEFWHVLQLTEMKRRIRCVTEINLCQNHFPDENETIIHICQALQNYFGAPGITISLIKSREQDAITFFKYFLYYKLPDSERFTARFGFSHYCAASGKPFIVCNTEIRSGSFIGKIIEYNIENIRTGAGKIIEIPFIRTKKTAKDEESLMFVPLRSIASREVIGVLKIGEYDTPERYDEANLSAAHFLSYSVGLLLSMLEISRAASDIGLSISNQREFIASLETIMMYKEISLGLFHQVSNYLNEIDNTLKEAEILDSEVFGTHNNLREFSEAAKKIIVDAKKLISRAQKRGQKTVPQQTKCLLLKEVLLDVIEIIMRSMHDTEKGRRIRIEKSLGSFDYEIVADLDFLSESFINVLNNAIWAVNKNANQADKRVSIYLREQESSKRVEIRIIDNGIGMKSEIQNQAFNVFFTTKGNRGTGLGLFFARKVIEQCSGEIKIEKSYPMKGSTVLISLPFIKKIMRRE